MKALFTISTADHGDVELETTREQAIRAAKSLADRLGVHVTVWKGGWKDGEYEGSNLTNLPGNGEANGAPLDGRSVRL